MTRTADRTGRAIRLSPLELLACWEALGLGDPPYLLRMRRPGGTREAREQARRRFAAAIAGLAERGLSDGGRPAPVLADQLRLLAHADYHLDIRFTGPAGRPILGLGAVLGAHGLTVVSQDGHGPFDLTTMDGAGVAAALLGLLGSVKAGPGVPVNIPGGVFDEACAAATDGSPWSLADQLRARGVPRADASSLARMCAGVDFGGQLGVTGRFGGPERRGPWVVGFVRSPAGYFMQLRRDDTVTACPANADRLLYQWRRLLERVAA